MKLIDADIYVTVRLYDDEHEEYRDERMTIAECLDRFTDEGCPTERKPKQEWVPCSKRLPSDEEDVIAWVESGDVARIACCNYANEVWFDVIMNVKVSPIAWMPCPEPYIRVDYEKNPSVEPKQGKWIKSHIGTIAEGYFCTNCGKRGHREDFCPNCGAKMKGIDDGEMA